MGLDLTEDVFSHGHLYVDVTRPEHRDNIRVLAPPERVRDGVAHVRNVVYQELIVSPLSLRDSSETGFFEDGDEGASLEEQQRPPSPSYGDPDPSIHPDQEDDHLL